MKNTSIVNKHRKSSRKIADALNASKVTTPQGKTWGNRQVLRLLERIDYQPA